MDGSFDAFLRQVDAGGVYLVTDKRNGIETQVEFFSTKCHVLLTTLLKYSANVLDEIVIVIAIDQKIVDVDLTYLV